MRRKLGRLVITIIVWISSSLEVWVHSHTHYTLTYTRIKHIIIFMTIILYIFYLWLWGWYVCWDSSSQCVLFCRTPSINGSSFSDKSAIAWQQKNIIIISFILVLWLDVIRIFYSNIDVLKLNNFLDFIL